ncbi:MAG: glycosyltransferase [Alphaproteobacteria bacterium]|nr:glycosyltransferase [Alphaproteobacteria bacterium]
MAALAVATFWCALVGWLLARVLRQFRVHAGEAVAAIPPSARMPSVQVIVPARDEAAVIGGCLAALSAQAYPSDRLSFVVVDDDSRDDTAGRVREAAVADPRIALRATGALPPGWPGKPHACWRGADGASADWFCFVDADVRADPLLLASAVRAAEAQQIDLLSLQPFQELGSLGERLVVPAGLLMVACAKDLRAIDDPASPEANANGQFMLMRREAYEATGGHAAVRAEICEDRALARLAKRCGMRVRVLAAEHLARTRMYRDFASLWEGFSKNAVDIMGDTRRTVLVAAAGLLVGWATFLLPLGLALVALHDETVWLGMALALALAGSGVVVGVEIGTARHLRVPPWQVALFPAGFTLAAVLAWRSVRLRRRGGATWKGRELCRPVPGGS